MNSLPSGTVTFLFTDIEGSTKLAQEHPDMWESLRERHHSILESVMDARDGYVFHIIGDAFCVAFSSATEAVNAALEAQRSLYNETWLPAPVKVRMGIHTGTAQLKEDGQYIGYATLATTQRVMSAGHGGQILISGATRELIRGMLSPDAELIDLGEKRLKDLLQPEHMYQLATSGLPTTFPPLRTLDSFPNNLPGQLTTFIGREQEIAQVQKELQSHRVVTLTGSGGAGKTRLSVEVGAACLEQFKHGVWFVELASLTDPSLIISAIMSALGVHEKENDIGSLTNYIGNQFLLIILDNCEHLIEDCARLVERIIQACPNVSILASSREAFGISGEQPYHVPSLPFPDPKHLPSLDEIAQCESVQLFIERAKTYVPSFSLTEKNASTVVQICCRLDGIPLALELAAARMKVMSVDQLASRLGDVFNLLTSGSRTALPRQQTLRALIEWSYDLLSESEKMLFRRLAVFSGGWSLDAAEAVCGLEGSESVLDDLTRLVDKSLVIKEELDGDVRFHMLETIRQYAEFKLYASEEVEEVKNRHRDGFLQLAETAEPKLRTGEQLPWLDRLETEHDNLRGAMKWSIEQKHVEQALRIPSTLTYFWEIHGHEEEGRNWLEQVLALEAQSPERKYPYAWATAVSGLMKLSWHLPESEKHKPLLEEALDIFRKDGNAFKIGHTLYYLAAYHFRADDLETAVSKFQEGLRAYQTVDDQWGIGECLHCIAHIAEQQGKIEESYKLYAQSVELLKLAGDRYSLFHPAGDTAIIALNKGELSTVRRTLEESLRAFEELKSRLWTLISINRFVELFYAQGEYENARKTIRGNLQSLKELNDLGELCWCTYLKGKVELAEGNLSAARQSLNEALAIAEKINRQYHMGQIKAALGLIACYEGNFAGGKEAIEIGIEKVRKEYPSETWPLLIDWSYALWLEKDLQGAAHSYRDTIQQLQSKYFFIRIPECLEGLGKIAVRQNDLEDAARLFAAAEAMREKMGTPIPPIQREEYENSVSVLHTELDEARVKRIWDEGRAMTRDEAVQYAVAKN